MDTMSWQHHGRLLLPFWVGVFILSGVAGPMLITQARYTYAPSAKTLWPLYPLYLGNLLAGAFSQQLQHNQWRDATRLFALDMTGQIFTNLGLLIVGPPVYAILYKSVTVFTGFLSLQFLPPTSHPTRQQWLAMLLITGGLCIQGVYDLETPSAGSGSKQLFGTAFVLLGCVFFAGGAVASELYLGVQRDSLGPLQAAWVLGVEGSVAAAIWAAGTVRGKPFSLGFWVIVGALVVSNACHQAAWFLLVGRLGACATAVLKALQSVCLFLCASALFCPTDPTECLNWEKVISFIVVSLGVLIYSYPAQGNGTSPGEEGHDETTPFVSIKEMHSNS